MKGVERAPFAGSYTRIGPRMTKDSVVVLLHNESVAHEPVIKWNRSEIADLEEAHKIITFRKKALSLYNTVLGSEYIVPTDFVIGEKVDNSKTKIKVYQVQPYVSGWDGKTLPEDLRNNEQLVDNWSTLLTRLSLLYIISNNVNRHYAPENRFPVDLTVGDSRKLALEGQTWLGLRTIPRTQNLLIDRRTMNLQLCDIGEYIPWSPDMKPAYEEIFRKSVGAVQALDK